jgi:hypothetical protein
MEFGYREWVKNGGRRPEDSLSAWWPLNIRHSDINPNKSRHSRESRDFNQVIYLTLEHLFEPEVEFKII